MGSAGTQLSGRALERGWNWGFHQPWAGQGREGSSGGIPAWNPSHPNRDADALTPGASEMRDFATSEVQTALDLSCQR